MDASPGVRDELTRALRGLSLEAISTPDPAEAIAILGQQPVDMIIADDGRESLSGIGLLENCRVRHPHIARVLLTGNDDFHAITQAVNRSQIAFFLSKPWTPKLLIDCVSRMGPIPSEPSSAEHETSPTPLRGEVLSFADSRARLRVAGSRSSLRAPASRLKRADARVESIAHEIRNPLTAIGNAADLLLADAAISGADPELVRIISSESRRLARTLDQHANGTAAKKSVASADAVSIARDVVALIRHDSSFPDRARVTFSEGTGLPALNMDRDQLGQVMWNLLRNAAAAISPGGEIQVELRCAERNGRWGVCIAVDDDGPGIPAELQGRVLERYASRRPGGSGLGLAIVKEIADEAGGSVEIGQSKLRGARVAIFVANANPERTREGR